MISVIYSQIIRTITLLITIFSLGLPAYAKYSGGTGEPNDPYKITTAEDLITLGETPEDYDKYFILISDIDLDPNLPGRKVFDKAVIAPDINDVNDGFQGIAFSGIFDGNGHIISHLTIVGKSYLGLFGQLGFSGVISDLGIEAADVNGTGDYVGGFVGHNSGDLITSFSTGVITGTDYVGGLAGLNAGHSNTWGGSPAPIVQVPAIIANCYSTISVSGSRWIGGAVGLNGKTDPYTGNSYIQRLYWHPGDVLNCYATGSVEGNEYVGGLVGENDKDVGTIRNSFWDVVTTGQDVSAGGIGKNSVEMQTMSTFLDWATCEGIWTIDEDNDYPRLWWEGRPGDLIKVILLSDFLLGSGIEDDPYLIYTPEELNMVSLGTCDWDKHFKLMADIDLSGFDGKNDRPAFSIIAPDTNNKEDWFQGIPFTGIFDGNGHTISNLTIAGDNYLGLFGLLGDDAEVKKLGVVDVNIVGLGNYVGGIVGNNDGILSQCYSTGFVTGNEDVGGLVGRNYDGVITNCYSICDVFGIKYVGGLAGSGGSISNCYSTSAIFGNEYVGGLLGIGGRCTNCFWDTQTSGQLKSAGGTGLTTDELQRAITYIEWVACESECFWTIDEGSDCPRLRWENKQGEELVFRISDFLTGSGTENDPYLIYTAEQLNVIEQFPCDLDKHFKLMADIDLSAHKRTDFNIIGRWFTGVFDGNGKNIYNFTYTSTSEDGIGLFRYVSEHGQIKNLGIIDANVDTGTGDFFGILVARNYGTINNCYTTGTVSGTGVYVGGIVGENNGDVSNSHSDTVVIGNHSIGGLVGYNYNGVVDSCYSTGVVRGRGGVGGLMGNNNSGTVTQCFNTASVFGDKYIGGLASQNTGRIDTSYNAGIVIGIEVVGGLVGHNWGSVTTCYNIGTISGDLSVGGLIGINYGLVKQCFWDTDTSGLKESAGGIGMMTAEIKTSITFLEAGWDFVDETANGTDDIWWIDEGNDYPRLWWELIPEN